MIILDSAILSGASVCGDATLRGLTFPTQADVDRMMKGFTGSSAHQWAQFLHKWAWTGSYLYTVKQKGTDEIAQVYWSLIWSFFKRYKAYAFQYIYCNYCKNLNTDLRAATQFDLFCPLLFFFSYRQIIKVGPV